MKATFKHVVLAGATLSLVATACGSDKSDSKGSGDAAATSATADGSKATGDSSMSDHEMSGDSSMSDHEMSGDSAMSGDTMSAASGDASTMAAATGADGTRACIVLPDADSGTRWESGDRPALEKALTDAGFEADIQNAQSDTAKYATIVDQQLTKGCGVMLLVDYQGAGITAAEKAKAQGIPVIAYDRPIEGADYYVSFDNFKVGELQGQTIVSGLTVLKKDPKTASVIYSSGDPSDGNAKMFFDGAKSVLDAAGVKPAAELAGTWEATKAGTEFEQAYTKVQGKVDAVLAPNDTNAAAFITILDKNGITAVMSGQDASVAGLQNVLLEKQTATVYKPFQLEATEASNLAIALLKGESPEAPSKLEDGTPFFPLTPILVGPKEVQQVIDNGDAKAADVCKGDVAAACTKYGVK